MKEITVLLPIDDSEGSQLAIDKARELTEKYNAHFILLTSLDISQRLTGYEDIDSTLQARMEAVGNKIHEKAKEQLEGFDVKSELVIGRPGEQILDFIDRNPIDLVIMATQNQSRLKRFFMGSVTNFVLNHTTVPVLVIPMKGQDLS